MLFFSPLTIHDFGRFHVIFYTLGFRAFVGSYPPQCSGGVGVVGGGSAKNRGVFVKNSVSFEEKAAL